MTYKVGNKFRILEPKVCACNAPAGGYIEIIGISGIGEYQKWHYKGYTAKGEYSGSCYVCYGPLSIGKFIEPIEEAQPYINKYVDSMVSKTILDYTYTINLPMAKKKGFMTKLNTMMKKLLSVDTQTLIKAGYINGDLAITEAGKEALMAILFDSNKAALVVAAQSDIDEEEKEDK